MKNILKGTTELNGPRFILRAFESTDSHNVFKGLSNEEVIKYYGVNYDSLESSINQLLWFDELETTGKGIWWAISDINSNTFYGAIGFNNFVEEYKKIEIGFWLLPEYWGKGIITEVLDLACVYAFESLNVHRVEAFVEVGNYRSSKTLLKNGFIYEGTMTDCEVKNHKFISLQIYAKFKTT